MNHFVNDFASSLLAKAQELVSPLIGREGVVINGSWQPTGEFAGTAETLQGDTASVLGDDGDAPISHAHISVGTTAIGDQYGPRGGERAVLLPTQSGWIKIFHHGPDDSPGAPAGELWRCHYNAAGQIDAYIKLTNDGDAGDALGGLSMLTGSRFVLETASGFTVIIDDVAKAIRLGTPGGLALILDDTLGKILIGKGGLGAPDSVMTQSDAQTLANAIIESVQTAFNTFAATVQSGSGVPPPTVGPVTATGSSITESEE
jgi:hypothetical protein